MSGLIGHRLVPNSSDVRLCGERSPSLANGIQFAKLGSEGVEVNVVYAPTVSAFQACAGSSTAPSLPHAVCPGQRHHPDVAPHTFRDPEPLPQPVHGAATAVRGQKFPVMMIAASVDLV